MRPRILKSATAEFRRFMAMMLARRDSGAAAQVDKAVTAIIGDVRGRGDAALLAYTRKFDGVHLTRRRLRVSAAELKAAPRRIPAADRRALELAAKRIEEFHRRTLETSFGYVDRLGMRLGQMVRPLKRVGIYVPGGLGAYPSSVLMNAIPARVAGVEEIVMVSPPSREGERRDVMAAAAIAGVTEYYRVGGAHAVAALAYGSRTIAPVDKIVGPGNAYVQAAKRMVYGVTDIDKMAGPSEVMVIADNSANPAWIAADLIAQAEHGSGDESAMLLTPSAALAESVANELDSALRSLPRAAAVKRVLSRRGALVIVRNLAEAFQIANLIGPEHLELEIRDARRWLKSVKAAGAVFLGGFSPAPLGDYLAGPNHVLPTGGSARFASPLGAYDFLKRTSIIEASPRAVETLTPTVAHLARMEGFEGHARAMELRVRSRGRAVEAVRL
jgi:histidinol dehydrogenase